MVLRRNHNRPELAQVVDLRVPDSAVARSRFNSLVLPHVDGAYRYARFLTRDRASAEDVAHNAFLKAFRAVDQCHGDPRAWLFAIVRNCHHDWVRANARLRSVESIGETQDEVVAADNPEREAQMSEVYRIIESLAEPFREAIVLREIEGMTYREIAQVTKVPIGTVMSRLARARQMLCEVFGIEGGAAEGVGGAS
jgi:RNA polymerase sigma-70 factor (ECF subfamily)